MKFAKSFLHSRWSVRHRRVFKYQGNFYLTHFSRGATEMQDEQPYEYDPEEIDCPEMKEVAKLINGYEEI